MVGFSTVISRSTFSTLLSFYVLHLFETLFTHLEQQQQQQQQDQQDEQDEQQERQEQVWTRRRC